MIHKKPCATCGKLFERKRSADGILDAHFATRKFCSPKCYAVSLIKSNPATSTGRKRAQRQYIATSCSKCGDTSRIQRHHRDRNPLNNDEKNMKFYVKRVTRRLTHKRAHGVAAEC